MNCASTRRIVRRREEKENFSVGNKKIGERKFRFLMFSFAL